MTQEELVRFRAGDPAHFRLLVERYSPRLLAYATHLTGERASAHDLVQESWLQAYRRRESFTGEGVFLGWLIAIAYHRFVSDHRRDARRESRLPAVVVEGSTHVEAATVSEHAENAELRRAIAAALAELPPRQRDVVVRRLLEDRSVRETAAELGIAEGTVKAALHHGLAKLRNLLREWKP
jgi:RNA polymerase sigma-70 factor, ECF subfamily